MSSNIKLDKETLIKHRFWIALGVFVPLWLVAWLVLWLSVSDAVQVKKDEYEKSNKEIAKVTNPKTEHFTKPMTGKKDTLTDRKITVWREVQTPQGGLTIDWKLDDKTPNMAKLVDAPFGSPIAADDVSERQEFRDNLYKEWKEEKRKQFAALAGPVTLNFDSVIGMAPIDGKENATYMPSMEEIWLNQETVWAKRELLWIIRQALDRLAYFERVEPSEKETLPAGVVARHHFRNSNWELDLLLKPAANRQVVISKDSTIKNVNAGKRTLPLREVRVWVAQVPANDPSKTPQGPAFTIQGDPVAWNKAVPIGQDVRVDNYNFDLKQPIFATQVFTWGTSPIKEIDALELGYQSSRTAFQELIGLKKDEAQTASPSTSSSPTGTISAKGANPTAAATKSGESQLGINLKRYIQVTPQVRRIPVGIVMVMDQAYVEDVMAQFVNSNRLRFQPTQVQWQQASGIRAPDPDEQKEGQGQGVATKPGTGKPGAAKPGKGGGMIPGGPGGAGPGGMGMMLGMQNQMQGQMRSGGAGQQQGGMALIMGMQSQMMGGPGGAPGGIQPGGGTGASSAAAAEESDPNLVEFALYGIISMYDYVTTPTTPPGTQQGTQAQPAQPGVPAEAQPKPGDQPKTDVTPKAGDQPKTDATPKATEEPKPDSAPKTDNQPKNDAAPKADEKKSGDKPAEGEAKKPGENKGN